MTPNQNAAWDSALEKLRAVAPDATLDCGALNYYVRCTCPIEGRARILTTPRSVEIFAQMRAEDIAAQNRESNQWPAGNSSLRPLLS